MRGGEPTAGRALLVAILVFFLVGLVWLWTSARAPRASRPEPAAAPAHTAGEPQPEPAPLREPGRAPVAPDAPDAPVNGELEPFVGARTSPDDFIGPAGTVRGRVEVAGEEPFPASWTLVARPARYLPGRETAVERRLELAGGQREFVLAELPLGGYELAAEAPGFNGPPLPVLLEKRSASPYVVLHLVPAGLLEGRVLDADGVPAEGVALTLFAQQGGEAREAVTDAAGIFRFAKLPDGAYDLLIGREGAVLVPERRPLRFAAPRLTFPDIELPPLGTLEVRVVDSLERPMEGVEVRGSGSEGGLVEGRTDHDGRLVARHLPAGRYRLRLSHPALDEAYATRVAVDVVAGQVAEAPVLLGP
ncbi:MAG TPA: carboxypeptidase regulatory-like domain-containing protein [Planctomycetota bacterium]